MRGIHPRLYRVTVVNTDGSSNVMRLPRDIPVLRLVDDMRNSLPWTPGSDVVNRDDDFQRAYEQRYAHLKVQPMESNQLEKARLMLQARLVANKGKPAQAAASATDAQSRMRKALAMAGAASTAEEKARSKQVADQQKAEEAAEQKEKDRKAALAAEKSAKGAKGGAAAAKPAAGGAKAPPAAKK